MKRVIQILFSILLFLCLGGVLLLYPAIWKGGIESYLNTHVLKDKGWTISIAKLEGHVFSSVSGEDIHFRRDNETEIHLQTFLVDLGLFSFFTGTPIIDELSVNKFSVVLNQDKSDTTDSIKPAPMPLTIPYQIHRLQLDGNVHLPSIDSTLSLNIDFSGSILQQDENLVLIISGLKATDEDSLMNLDIEEATVEITQNHMLLSPLKGKISSIPFDGEVLYSWDAQKKLLADIRFLDYSVPGQLFEKVPLKPKFSQLSGRVIIDTDFKTVKGDLSLKNNLGLDMAGKFLFHNNEDHLLLDRLQMKSEQAELSITGLVEHSGRVTSRIHLSNFDIGEWLLDQRKTNLNGVLLLDGSAVNGQITDITLTMEVLESKLYTKDAIFLSGSVAYHDSVLRFLDPLYVAVGPSSLKIQGFADFRLDSLDLHMDLQDADIFLINNFWADSLEEGTATGSLELTGPFDGFHIRGEIQCKNIVYKGFYLESAAFTLNVNNGFQVTDGFTRFHFKNGAWQGKNEKYILDNGTIDVAFHPERIELEYVHIISGDNYLQLSGNYLEGKTWVIDRVQLMYDHHFLINPKPIKLTYTKEKIEIKPFVLHVDDGIAEGYFSMNHGMDGLIKLSNIDANIFSYFVEDDRMNVEGNTFGEVSINKTDKIIDIAVDVSLKNGSFAHQSFDDLILSFFIHDGILHVEEISLTNRGLTGAQVTGVIPLKKTKMVIPFNIKSSFHNLNVEVLTQFIPNWFTLGGHISGNYNLSGNDIQTTFDFDVNIDDAMFDVLPLGYVEGKGNYDGNFLNFTSFSSISGEKHLIGSASLPIDFNIGSEKIGRAILKDPVQVDVAGKGDELWFLSQYVSTIDSIKGNFDIALQIYGTWENLIRDGYFKLEKSKLYTSLLEYPIVNLSGSGTWENNQLLISDMKGRMREQPGKKCNLHVTGDLDMSQFFRPRYDISAKGENIYFSAITEDLSGDVDIDVHISGKDTLTVAGDVTVLDVEMFKEFTATSVGEISDNRKGIIMDYRMKFPIEGEFTLLNNQIDATFGGDIGITKIGNSPADFSGEVFIKEGKFYYSSDIFTITEGFLSFGKKGFNPYLDIAANTSIDNEQIDITFNGPLDNPRLILTSESGFSQSDILELLTWGKRFEEQEFSSTGFGTQAFAKFESWFEQQLDRKILQISGLDKLGLMDDISVSGAGNLINPNNGEEFTIKAGLSDNVSLNYAYKRSFSLTNPTHAVGMEYKVNRYFSVIGNVDQHGKIHAKYRLRYSY